MTKSLTRWGIFLLIGYPLQLIFNVLYVFVHLYWVFFLKEKLEKQPNRLLEIPESDNQRKTRCAQKFHRNDDNHNMLTHWGLVSTTQDTRGLQHLIDPETGSLLRRNGKRYPNDGWLVSGDCTISWCFAYTMLQNGVREKHMEMLRTVAKSYLKNLGHVSNAPEDVSGWVSARCNNFGLNYCPDGAGGFLGQPMAGPQFFTSHAVFALAARDLGGIWKLVAAAHWWLMAGWLWSLSPVLYLPKDIKLFGKTIRSDKLGYARDVTMKALWCCKFAYGERWWTKIAMKWIDETIAEHENQLFSAIRGLEYGKIPKAVDPWAFQQTKPTNADGPSTNVWIKGGFAAIDSYNEGIKVK